MSSVQAERLPPKREDFPEKAPLGAEVDPDDGLDDDAATNAVSPRTATEEQPDVPVQVNGLVKRATFQTNAAQRRHQQAERNHTRSSNHATATAEARTEKRLWDVVFLLHAFLSPYTTHR